MPQLSTPPPSKKSSGTDFLSFQNKKGRSPSQSPPTLLNRTSVTPESKKNGGFLNKLLRRLSTTKSTGTTSSSSRSARSTVGSKYTGGSSFSTLVSPHFADGKANTNGSGQITPERTRLRKNSVLGRSRSRSRRSSNTNSEHDILDDDRSSMYDDDDNSSTAASSISRASLSLDSVSLESKSNLTYLDEQVGGVKQNNNHTFDFWNSIRKVLLIRMIRQVILDDSGQG